MRGKARIDTTYSQMRWVVLLLIIVVVLPTVCLLWFITQVVRNERLAVRQKLIKIYQEQSIRAAQKSEQDWQENIKFLSKAKPEHPYRGFLILTIDRGFDGLIVYNAEGNRIYPVLSIDEQSHAESSEEFNDAWQLEFVENNYTKAAKLYEQKTQAYNDLVRLTAIIGKGRCLAKLGRLDEAVDEYKQVAFSPLEKTAETELLVLIGNARLLLLNLVQENAEYSALFKQTFEKLFSMVYSVNEAGFALPTDHNLFLAQKLVEIAGERTSLDDVRGFNLQNLERLITAEELSIRASDKLTSMVYSVNEEGFVLPADQKLFLAQKLAEIASKRALPDDIKDFNLQNFERLITAALEELPIQTSESFPEADTLGNIKKDKLQYLPLEGETFFSIYHESNNVSILALLSKNSIASIFTNFETDFRDSGVAYRIVDEYGRFIRGDNKFDDEPFTTVAFEEVFPGWKIELSFKEGDVFEKATNQRIAVYIWTGVLVILLILIAAGIAAQTIRKQIKLNKLKNDFIATVSHELKTPLASIRLLVDTLLQGNYKDQQQAVEYFQLVSKENERLIDNFLTFSRMERNKKAFEMTNTNPADIALAAAGAVKAKFHTGRCDFQVQIANDLPNVFADLDAIVTVLVNLLDNAYKYSYDDKKIELKVFSENNMVCFSVKDNGIGMIRRQIRKIFDRFYQADTSLSRRAEGTGLGLSIVKFIVDAHKGTISVDSRLDEGSTFTVRLPASG